MNKQSGYKKTNSWSVWSVGISILICLSCIFIGGPNVVAVGAPDLVVMDLQVSPQNPAPGDQVEVSAQVLNQGSTDTSSFYVRLYINDEHVDRKRVSFGLDAGEVDTVSFTWTAEPGRNELKVVADDPFDRINESNEDNNSRNRVITVTQSAEGTAGSKLNIAVLSFKDKSNSGFANVSNGLADMLTGRLVNSGFNVLERQEIKSILFEQKLNPSNTSDLAQASSIAGADAIITGSVTDIDINKTTISLGFVSVTGATVRVNMSYRVISAYTSQILSADSVTAKAEGQISGSFNFGAFLSSVSQVSTNVCAGGFRTDKNVYAQGEVINVGYLDPIPSRTFTIRFYDSSGFSIGPPMPFQTTFSSNNCVTWSWNPSPPLAPGNYSVKLLDTSWNVLSTKNFTVSAGATPPAWVNQITFGTKEFADSVVGEAVEKALSRVSSSIASTLNSSASTLLSQRREYSGEEEEEAEKLKCQVASLAGSDKVILTGVDGNCGKDEKVEVDDIFYIYSAESVQDPNTGELIEIIPKSDEPKGKVIVLDVYEKACRAQLIGSFSAKVGDLAIRK